jgi:hypothetical protein
MNPAFTAGKQVRGGLKMTRNSQTPENDYIQFLTSLVYGDPFHPSETALIRHQVLNCVVACLQEKHVCCERHTFVHFCSCTSPDFQSGFLKSVG